MQHQHLILQTPRLLLRPFVLEDASLVQQLASDPGIAQGTLAVPHPCPDGWAETWITSQREQSERGEGITFAITYPSRETLIGTVYLHLELAHARGEMGYWIGTPFWGQGYATEAARAIVDYAFDSLNLNRVYAYHFSHNPASGRVMQKIGMQWEGRRRQHTLIDGVFVDSEGYATLRSEYRKI